MSSLPLQHVFGCEHLKRIILYSRLKEKKKKVVLGILLSNWTNSDMVYFHGVVNLMQNKVLNSYNLMMVWKILQNNLHF